MAGKEQEAPFANSILSIARDVAAGHETSVPTFLAELEAHMIEINTYPSSWSRERRANIIVGNVKGGAHVHRVISVALVTTSFFSNWPEIDRRYLLDRAVGEDIMRIESFEDREGSREAIYGKRTIGNPVEDPTTHLRQLRARIRERAIPSSGPMRR